MLFSNRTFDRLGDFSCDLVVGHGPKSLCLIAAGSAKEICFGGLSCQFWQDQVRGRGCHGCFIVGEFFHSIGFCTFLLIMKINFYFLVLCIYCK